MASEENVYELSPGGEPVVGFGHTSGSTIKIGAIGYGVTLDLEADAEGKLPRIHDGKLLEAAPLQFPNGPRSIVGRGSWQGALLKISTFPLDFEPGLSTQVSVENSWPGAEVPHGAFVQVMKRQMASQYQLVAIEDAKFIIVGDRQARYIRIDCHNGRLFTRPAQRFDLGRLLVQRAELMPDQLEVLNWTWYALGQLGMRQLWPDTLGEKLRALRKLKSRT